MRLAVRLIAVGTAVAALAACTPPGKVPAQVRGVWGADCSEPFVRFEADRIHVYPDGATYDVTSANLSGSTLAVAYDAPSGGITETYVLAGDTLRLATGTYGAKKGVKPLATTWSKAPMKKCPAA